MASLRASPATPPLPACPLHGRARLCAFGAQWRASRAIWRPPADALRLWRPPWHRLHRHVEVRHIHCGAGVAGDDNDSYVSAGDSVQRRHINMGREPRERYEPHVLAVDGVNADISGWVTSGEIRACGIPFFDGLILGVNFVFHRFHAPMRTDGPMAPARHDNLCRAYI